MFLIISCPIRTFMFIGDEPAAPPKGYFKYPLVTGYMIILFPGLRKLK